MKYTLATILLLLSQLGSGPSYAADDAAIDVYSQRSKIFLASIPMAEYEVVSQTGEWQIVRFREPIVPVWFSRDYVRMEGNLAIVTANGLNLRNAPSIQSSILARVSRGFRRPVIQESGDFLQVHAPIGMAFAIRAQATRAQLSEGLLEPEPVVETGDATAPDSGLPLAGPSDSDEAVVPDVQAAEADNLQAVASTPAAEPEAAPEEEEAASAADSTLAQQHRLAPGDSISLIVFGEPDLSLDSLRIPQSGSISFPLIGEVEVTGKTTTEVEQVVRDKLSGGFVRSPRLTIKIEDYRPVFVRGAALRVGAFPYTEDLTVAKLLALAGGAKNSALANGVSISRNGLEVESGLSIDSMRRVYSGDIVSIEEELGVGEESSLYVYLHGEVKRPGEYRFRRGLTVEKAVVLAGGFTLRASRRKISVSRIVEGELKPEKLNKVDLYLPVQPGDIIDVGASWF